VKLTKEQANLRLQSVKTKEELRALIMSIDTSGHGSRTILWSGAAGFHGPQKDQAISAQKIASSLQQTNSSLRTLESTQAGMFLDINRRSKNFNQQLSDKLNQLFQDNPDGIREFLYGPTSGSPKIRTGKGLWDEVSEKFVMQAQGDVRLLVGGAALDKVFAQTELKALLANNAVTSVEGVPIEGLRNLEKISGTDKVLQLLMGLSEANTGMINVKVDSAGRPIQTIDGTYHVDATDYMKMNTLGTVAANEMRPVMDFIPEERRLKHQQAVEEIFKLHPILRDKSYPLQINADPFEAQRALARIGTYAGHIANIHDVSTMLAEAGAQLHQGEHRSAHDTVVSWLTENAGALIAGRLATLLVAPLMATGPLGMIIGAGIILGASVGGADLAKKLKKKLEEAYDDLERMNSPLVLDLDGNGIQTISLRGTAIYFDHDSNGFAEKTGWVGPNDGLLVLDLNQNGKVDNGGELFGNHTLVANGRFARNGFEALARYDSNRDGKIDNRDTVWNQLRVWRDRNSNAINDTGELVRLEAVNTKSLLLAYKNSNEVDANGNAHKEKGFYERTNGQRAALTDVWFAKNTLDSRQPQLKQVDARTAALPNLPGIGIVPSLHQTLMGPRGGEVRVTLSRWLQATRLERMNIKQELLFQWCGADQNPFFSDIRFIDDETPFNREKVTVIEKLMGQMTPYTENGVGTLRMEAIQSLTSEIEVYVDMMLSNQVHVQPLIDMAIPVETSIHGPLQMDLSGSVTLLRSQFKRDPDPAFIPMIQWQLAQRGPGGVAFFNALKKEMSSQSDALGLAMRSQPTVSAPWEWRIGTGDHDVLSGSALDDFIEAGDSYDYIEAHAGNDTLHGGPGHDSYYGGPGGDTYYISQNGAHAYDTIFDESSPAGVPDRVMFWETPSSQVRLQQTAGSVNFYSGQRLLASIEKQLNPQHRVEEFHFADGVIWDHNALLLQLPILGTPGNDRLLGTANTSNRLQGLAGQDTLIGGTLADHLEGQQGNDLLTGLTGQDTLDGGEGNDRLEGGEGGDRYLFAANGGHDRLHDVDQRTSETDRVLFSNLSTTALTRVQRLGQDLQLHFGSSTSLTLVNQLQPFSRIEEFQFANGPTWTHATLLQQVR